ncbi:MAG: formate--tetrahydrofolate ligase [Moraxella sp.]|nr:formate--tetrahydrofolate ligase [Moraxella sp.]
MPFNVDADIARQAILAPMRDIAQKLNLQEKDIIPYGYNKAKIEPAALAALPNKQGKVVLVTAINPTPMGEGKTMTAIGLSDALNQLQAKTGKQAVVALREPSLGPVFGIKGGAAGGGLAQVLPMEEINLHFTGDFHAITAANNLLAAMIDNHIYQGNALNINPERVLWRRALDMNDRQLRHIISGQGGDKDGVARADGFDITVASEVMACFCLASDLADLKRRLGRILVAYDKENQPVFACDIQAEGAMTALLKDAIKPNLVQTIEGTPAIVHGGPFANIAHGCNSLIATNTARHLADIVVTEAGFGADLGAEKFCDIKCRIGGFAPSVAVVVATVRALKYNAGIAKDALNTPNAAAVQAGSVNLQKHIENLQTVFGLPVVVAINRFVTDGDDELAVIAKLCDTLGVGYAVSEVWAKGGTGGVALAEQVLAALDGNNTSFKLAYHNELPLAQKIHTIATKIYGADDVIWSDAAKADLACLQAMGVDELPVCIAKTPYSLSDNAKLLGRPTNFCLTVRRLDLSAGAGFVVVLCGNIMKMPGLPKLPAAHAIDVDSDGQIVGLF